MADPNSGNNSPADTPDNGGLADNGGGSNAVSPEGASGRKDRLTVAEFHKLFLQKLSHQQLHGNNYKRKSHRAVKHCKTNSAFLCCMNNTADLTVADLRTMEGIIKSFKLSPGGNLAAKAAVEDYLSEIRRTFKFLNGATILELGLVSEFCNRLDLDSTEDMTSFQVMERALRRVTLTPALYKLIKISLRSERERILSEFKFAINSKCHGRKKKQ